MRKITQKKNLRQATLILTAEQVEYLDEQGRREERTRSQTLRKILNIWMADEGNRNRNGEGTYNDAKG